MAAENEDVRVVDERRHVARRQVLLARLPEDVKIKPYTEFYYGNLFERYQWLVSQPYEIKPSTMDRTGKTPLIALFPFMDSLVALDDVRVLVYLDAYADPNAVRKYLQPPVVVVSTQHLICKALKRL